MALTVTLAQLREQAKDRADMARSNFIPDATWNTYINLAYSELYDLLVDKANDRYTLSATITTDGNSANAIGMPSNFYMLIAVDYQLNGTLIPMEPFVFADRYLYQDASSVTRYRLVGTGNNLMFNPIPPAQTMTLWYVPAITKLVADADTVDGVNGWEDLIVVSAAIKALTKEESDTSALKNEKAELLARVNTMSKNRDQGRPERVSDVRNLAARAYPGLGGNP